MTCMQEVNSSLYVYHEVLEGCGELVLPTEYTGLGQVCSGHHSTCHACEHSSSNISCQGKTTACILIRTPACVLDLITVQSCQRHYHAAQKQGWVHAMQVIEFRWAQLVWERFSRRDLQFLGSEYMPCGHLPSRSALVFVENHDRQSNCHVPDPEVPCISLTYQDGELYKVRAWARISNTATKNK